MLEEARKWVSGKDIYIDTAWCPNIEVLDPRVVVGIIREHGVDKVLFGSDYPTTTNPDSQIMWLKKLPLREEEKELIFRRNALFLLGQ